jgi:hypothetical protein
VSAALAGWPWRWNLSLRIAAALVIAEEADA